MSSSFLSSPKLLQPKKPLNQEGKRMAEKGNEKTYKAYVLVLPFPAQGHINPMLQFCKRLTSKGLRTTIVNTQFISNHTKPSPSSLISTATISDGNDEFGFFGADSPGSYLAKFRTVGSETLSDLIKKLAQQGLRVDGLVYNSFLPWALDVAREFGLVGALFFTQSCAVGSVYYHVHKGIIKLPLEKGKGILVPRLPPLERSEMPSFVGDYGSYPVFYEMLVNQFSDIDKADWVLFNTFYDLEQEVVDWMAKLWRTRTIGPTIPSTYLDKQVQDDREYGHSLFDPESSECMNWLNTKPTNSVIFISFGSMAELGTEQFEEIAWGLKETNYFFLWVVRESERSKLPEELADSEHTRKGLMVAWSPQLEVLAHESVGCFVSHCGFNSILETLSLGVPVVAVPQWTDQLSNAKYVEDVWGVGVRARKDEKGIVRREVLGECIREVMEGERGKEIKKNVVKWKKLAQEAVGAGGSSDKNIDEFVAELIAKS